MKITKLDTFIVPPRWCFLKIETDEGIVGWGEPVVEGRAHTVAAAVDELADYLVGKDPLLIEDHWTGHVPRAASIAAAPIRMSAIAGIDQALWDIKGKHSACRSTRCSAARCATGSRSIPGSAATVRATSRTTRARWSTRGFKAVKMNGSEELQFVDTFDKVQTRASTTSHAVREAVGPNVGIGVDFHGRVHKPMAKVLAKELEPFKLMFIEEPVLSENVEALRDIAATRRARRSRSASGSTRAGTSSTSSPDGYVDIIQPDPSHAGGITECRKIASMAEAYDVALALHCPLGPIALAACLQLDAVSYNAFIQEQSLGIHYNKGNDLLDYIRNPEVFEYDDGMVAIPQGPGLGIEVNEE